MIIGNPHTFSVFVSRIEEWNVDKTFCNGVLLLCIDGILFPKEVITVDLKYDVMLLKEKLENVAINKDLYNMKKEDAFIKIYEMAFPNDIEVDNDYSFDISSASLYDNDSFVFAVSNGEKIRILASRLDYIMEDSRHSLKNITVSETFISESELYKIRTEINKLL